MKKTILGTTLLLASVAFVLPVAAQDQPRKSITVTTAHATPGINEDVYVFGVPIAMGYFEEEGLEVTFQGASGSGPVLQMLQTGSTDFGAAESDAVMQARDEGANIKAFFTLKARSSYTVGVLPDSPIKELTDLEGKTIGTLSLGAGATSVVTASLQEVGLDANSYNLLATGGGAPAATALASGNVDALGVPMWAFGRMENDGMTIRYLQLAANARKAGFTLAASDATLASDRETAVKLCRGIAKGLYYSFKNPSSAIEQFYNVFPQAKPQNVDPATQAAADLHIFDGFLKDASIGTPDEPLGPIDPARWEVAAEFIKSIGIYEGKMPLEDSYDTSFVDECNDFDREAVAAQAAE